MPIATTGVFSRIEQLTDYWVKQLDDHKEDLGFNFIGGYDDPLTLNYPAVQVSSGQTDKRVHGTHMFLVQWTVEFWVMHAEASEDHRTRSREMLQLASTLVNFLEDDPGLFDEVNEVNRIIFGFVMSERAGIIRPRSNPGIFVVSTHLTYQATAEVPF